MKKLIFLSVFSKNIYLNKILLLLRGNAAVQVLNFLAFPIYTRLYTSVDFGFFGVYMAFVLIFSPIINLKLDRSIILIKESDKRSLMITGSLLISTVLSSLIALLGGLSFYLFHFEEKSVYLLLPLVFFFTGLTNVLEQLYYKKGCFTRISNALVVQSLGLFVFTLLIGYYEISPFGLIYGHVIGLFLRVIWLTLPSRELLLSYLKSFSFQNFKPLFREYGDFPKFGTASHGFSIIAKEITPVIMLAYFPMALIGQYTLAQRILRIVPNIVGGPIANSFYQHVNKLKISGVSYYSFATKNTFYLFMGSIIGAIVFYFIPNELIIWLLGDEWDGVKALAILGLPWFIALVPFMALSNLFDIQRRLDLELLSNIVFCCANVSVIYWFSSQQEIHYLILFSSILSLFMRSLFMFNLLRKSKLDH